MERLHLKSIDAFVVIWGAILCSGSVYFWETGIFLGVFVGSLLAGVNWIAFRWLMTRMIRDKTRKRIHYAIALAVKTLLIMILIGLIVSYAPVGKVAFAVGMSSLVLGIFTYSVKSALLGEGRVATEKDF